MEIIHSYHNFQFKLYTLWSDQGDIIFGSPWMEILGSFILNIKNNLLTFSYKRNKITLHDIIVKPNSITLEDIQDISIVIFQESKKILQNIQNEIDKIIADRNEEVFRLKDHSKKLIRQVKKLKKGNNS